MTYGFDGELAARREAAGRPYNEIIAKYAPIHGLDNVCRDYHYWHETVYDGDKLVNFSREYPKPYNDLHYFEHFVEKFLTNSSYLEARLGQEFTGDEIDADYIEGLLEEAKAVEFFTPGALIVYGIGTRRSISPNADGKPQYYLPAPGERVYVGSQVNLDRAERMRGWLRRRATELAQASPAPPAALAPTPASQVSELLAPLERALAALAENARSSVEKEADKPKQAAPKLVFSKKFTREQCDVVFEGALIIYDMEQGYGLRQGVKPSTFYGAVGALIKNGLLVGEIKHTVQQLSDLYGANINPNTQFKETTPKGRKNLAFSKGRKQIELALIKANLLQKASAYYLNKQQEL